MALDFIGMMKACTNQHFFDLKYTGFSKKNGMY